MLTNFLEWALTTIGLVYLVTQSAILMPVRKIVARGGLFFAVLIYCPACMGFWMGGVAWVIQDVELLQVAVSGCALGALWMEYGPASRWELEQGPIDAKETQEPDDQDAA